MARLNLGVNWICMQLMKAYVAETYCNQLLLIDWFCYIYANQDLFASCHNIAISLYNIIMYICSCMCGLGYIHTYVLPVCHLQELTAIPSGIQVMSLVFDWISKDLYLMSIHTRRTVGCYSWSTQGGWSLQTVYSGDTSTSLTEVTGQISPFPGRGNGVLPLCFYTMWPSIF